jgi:deoxyribonuclease-1
MKKLYVLFSSLFVIYSAQAQNQSNDSFSRAKKILEKQVYFDKKITLYCNAEFDSQKYATPPKGFNTTKYIKRSKKIEWEHVVPAENFGRTFTEWRNGSSVCVSSKGKTFKGRRCAEKTNYEYRHMQADMFNLYPAIGAVNALRSNYNFTILPSKKSSFGSCEMKISNKKAEPPVSARGRIARTYLYMDQTYSRYHMSRQQQQLMTAWDKMYPVDKWECQRAERISKLQGNKNSIVESRCLASNMI